VAKGFVKSATSVGGITTKREALIAIGEMGWESNGFADTSEWACSNGRWTKEPCDTYDTNGCPAGKKYFGRGYIQLTHCYNYKPCNDALMAAGLKKDIVNNPDVVASDPQYSWATALWFWNKNVHPKVQSGRFGDATRAINGGRECTPNGDTSIARNRWVNMQKCLTALKISGQDLPSEGGCY